uniref:N-lysine methyltransferase SETD6 isoform X4 n=1 Tax=Callithrix jacchus TaxID=9483 RepID=UPI00159E15AC|nr:N-lysine methyltransferase SETD6 isoform X4 [Callithrix jacchus]
MFSGGTIPAGANPGQCTAQTPKQAPRGSGAGAGPETPEVTALPTGPRGGSSSDHGDPGEAPTGEWWAQVPAFSSVPHPFSARRAVRVPPLCSLLRVSRPSPFVTSSHQSPFCARAAVSSSSQRAFGGRAWSLRALISDGRAHSLRRPGSCGRLLELVPAGGTGVEPQGGGQPAGHGGRLWHGGPGERAGRRAAVRGAACRDPVAVHLLYRRPVGASFQEPLEEEEDEKEPNSPVMVPAADILNHLANHNANLEYSADCLRMVATQPIPKGHEIFNTYGQMANWQLIHMYGFVEPYPDNTDDTADIQMVIVREAALQGTKTEAERLLLYERWDFLCKLEMVGEEGAFVIGREEVLTEEELTTTLKVLCMPAEEFREFKDQDGGGDDKREEGSLTVTNIPKLKASWRQLLRNSILLTLQTYATDLKTDKDVLSNKEVYAKLSWREQQALQVRYGQKMILHQLLELTN